MRRENRSGFPGRGSLRRPHHSTPKLKQSENKPSITTVVGGHVGELPRANMKMILAVALLIYFGGVSSMMAVQAAAAATSSSMPSVFAIFKTRGGKQHYHMLQSSTSMMRKLYSRPPHDVRLYDTLSVRSNATLDEIQRSYRRLSREWHPDKVAVRRRKRRRTGEVQPQPPPPPPDHDTTIDGAIIPPPPPLTNQGNNNDEQNDQIEEDSDSEEYARQRLAEISNAYEILSDDHTRLLYHRYGLVGGTDAAIQLLTGRVSDNSNNAQSANMMETTTTTDEQQCRLLELMGYPPGGYHSQHRHHHRQSSHNHQHQQKLAYLTATITERLRPLVEGTTSQELFVHNVYRECNALKNSPMGAQILRCIGRAYRIEGYRVLRTMHRDRRMGNDNSYWEGRSHHGGSRRRRSNKNAHQAMTDGVVDKWRDAKHYALAALAGGKLVLAEQKLKKLDLQKERRQEERRRRRKRMDGEEERVKRIQTRAGGNDRKGREDYMTMNHFASGIGALPGDSSEDYDDDIVDSNEIGALSEDDEDFFSMLNDNDSDNNDEQEDELEWELRHTQHQKTYAALLSVHQMEALWKITKIELDKTIRESCRRILDGEGGWHAFCQPEWEDGHNYHTSQHHRRRDRHNDHHRHHRHRPPPPPDGWVGTTGEGVTLEVGRLRAAASLILVGDIMVQCSKEGTGWNR